MHIVFDIETAPLPTDQIVIPPFDPANVKTGNLRDPDKIADKIRQAEEEHASNYLRNAALDPLTGRVVCIGVAVGQADPFLFSGDERTMLGAFWDSLCQSERAPLILGFNSKQFDLPFLIRRSWKHRVAVPGWIRRGRYWSDSIVDLREVWQLGDSRAHGSLAAICRHLGLGEKSGSGADFGTLWETDNAAAREYCLQDVRLTRDVAHILLALDNY